MQVDAAPTAVVARALYRVVQRVKQAQHDDPVDRSSVVLLGRLHEHGPMRLSDLAALLFLDVSTVSRHARSLEDLGYVERADDPTDGRAVRLSISAAGEEVLAKAFANRQAWLDRCLADWPAADRQHLAEQLDRLAEALARADR